MKQTPGRPGNEGDGPFDRASIPGVRAAGVQVIRYRGAPASRVRRAARR
jgi:hypothetical protein